MNPAPIDAVPLDQPHNERFDKCHIIWLGPGDGFAGQWAARNIPRPARRPSRREAKRNARLRNNDDTTESCRSRDPRMFLRPGATAMEIDDRRNSGSVDAVGPDHQVAAFTAELVNLVRLEDDTVSGQATAEPDDGSESTPR